MRALVPASLALSLTACSAPPRPRAAAPPTTTIARIESSSASSQPPSRDIEGGTIVSTPDRSTILAVDEDNGTLVGLDPHTHAITFTTRVADKPAAVVAFRNDRVAVVDRARARVALFDLQRGQLGSAALATRTVAPDPVTITASPDGRWLYVASGASSTLTALDADTLDVRFTVSMPREPRSIAVTPDGRTLYVGSLVGGRVTVVDVASRQTRMLAIPIALERRSAPPTAGPPSPQRNIAALARAVTLDASGRNLFVAYVAEANGTELTVSQRSDGYGGLDEASIDALRPVADVAVLDTRTHHWRPPSAATPVRRPLPTFADPTALGFRSDDGALVLVSRGTSSIGVLDADANDPALHAAPIATHCDGASGVVSDTDGDLFVQCAFDHAVVIVDRGQHIAARIQIGSEPLPPERALGRRLFHRADDADISRVGFSCATCHPDGRDDANVWSSDVGMRQTVTLAGRVDATAPYGWSGHNPTLDLSLQQTVIRLSGLGLDRERRDMLADYVTHGIDPIPRTQGEPSDPVLTHGRDVFAQAGCESCHEPGHAFTDRRAHDIGSRAHDDREPTFDTPSLVAVGETAPYFHDGRYATLEAMLADNHDRMGRTTRLSRADRDALLAYLRTL